MSERKAARHVALSAERRQAIGARLKNMRRGAGLTQEALSQASGVGTEHIQRVERGAGNPTIATLYALADALGSDPRDLLPDRNR